MASSLTNTHKNLIVFMLDKEAVWLQPWGKRLHFGRHKKLNVPAAEMQTSVIPNLVRKGLIERIGENDHREAGLYRLTSLGKDTAIKVRRNGYVPLGAPPT